MKQVQPAQKIQFSTQQIPIQKMPTPFLFTGVTGGLGAKILDDLLHKHNLPPISIIATSRSESNRSRFESQGLTFRVADYNFPETLEPAFKDVENLLFMSSSERDSAKRNVEHGNVIEAAKRARVKKVWYVSLAFGGFGDGSKIGFQQAHYETERRLVKYVQSPISSSKSAVSQSKLTPPPAPG